MDVRTFYGKIKSKTPDRATELMELKYADKMTRLIECCTATETEKQQMLRTYAEVVAAREAEREEADMSHDETYRQGIKDATEEFASGWEFTPTIDDLADGTPPMSKVFCDEIIYRVPNSTEKAQVLHEGKYLRFPVQERWEDGIVYTYETYAIPDKEWNAGVRWTLGRVWERAKMVYSKNNKKACRQMGDHRFWEGSIDKDGTIHYGS